MTRHRPVGSLERAQGVDQLSHRNRVMRPCPGDLSLWLDRSSEMARHPRRKANTTALVVSNDSGLREAVARWLDDDGLQVMICPGPRAPLFSCVGLRGEPCPLVGVADIVLLDLYPE